MVSLRTIRRVLAVEFGLSAEAVQRCIATAAPTCAQASDLTEIPLAYGLRIVATAEGLTAPACA